MVCKIVKTILESTISVTWEENVARESSEMDIARNHWRRVNVRASRNFGAPQLGDHGDERQIRKELIDNGASFFTLDMRLTSGARLLAQANEAARSL